ncbi:hypothetical protein NOK12_12780 [Nocardioides sp. OK12]|uniref:type II secretion system protein n=1 Tax=Nocardioides sp. OK12 TaxID=2758661 RepID=UPI0021C34206|nr:type II secretion system protein [Nocardioides sp. OK12]GHJ58760.1 hypothetical protein NOK12_12780 [Nocardioides sp. OK12]
MPASPPSAERRRGDAGYTMIEMIVVIAIAGTLMAAAVSGWQTWSRASAQDGLVTELRGVLRQAQQRAVTTGTSTCVLFDAASWSIYRGRCDDDAKVLLEGPIEAHAGLRLTDPRFQHGESAYLPGVSFAPRGTATPGRVTVERDGAAREAVVSVEGLTGRVTTD